MSKQRSPRVSVDGVVWRLLLIVCRKHIAYLFMETFSVNVVKSKILVPKLLISTVSSAGCLDMMFALRCNLYDVGRYIGESGHGSDGRIVRATQISQKCIKIGTPAAMCIFSLDRCMFHPIMRLD